MSESDVARLLPHPIPPRPAQRLLLFAIRRMAIDGLDDAHVASAFLTHFGIGFRRPLILLRATMAEVSRVARRRIALAPCCCCRATDDETRLIDGIVTAGSDPQAAYEALAGMLATQDCLAVLNAAQALAGAFADLGAPLQADQ